MTPANRIILADRWTPKSLPKLEGWWRSDAGVTVATGVSQWDDQSGNNRNQLQTSTSRQLSFSTVTGPAGLPGLTGDGTNDGCELAFTLNSGYTIYMLVNPTTWTAGDRFLSGVGASVNAFIFRQRASGGASPDVELFGGSSIFSSALTLGAWHRVCLVGNGANSVLAIDDNADVTGDIGTGNPGGLCIMNQGFDWASSLNGIVTEVFAYSAVHDAATREFVRNVYLKQRQGTA